MYWVLYQYQMNKLDCVRQVFGEFIAEGDIKLMAECFQRKSCKSGETIVNKGSVEKHFYLVELGVQMLYIINKNGEKVILGFSFHPSPTGAYDSFLKQTPSQLYFEAITETSLWSINRKTFDEFNEILGFMEWRAVFAERILFGRLQREVELTTFTAKERFEAFEKRMPNALQIIPQKYLASYLNMSPETFSRIRAERN